VSALTRRTPAWTITAALGVVYLIAAPPSPDLAAATYRSNLFGRVGFTLWDNAWYGGHHMPAYSLLAPALGWLLGPQPLAALSMTVATALFAALIAGRFPERSTRITAVWFALGASVALLSSRVPFDLGLAIGLGALVSAQRSWRTAALALSVLTAIASPVAGAFLALAFLAWALAGPARVWPGALTLATLLPIGLLVIVFPEGGSQPFVASAFYPALAAVLAVGALIPRRSAEHGREPERDAPESSRRVLRIGIALYALALLGSYVLPTAVGGNVDRLGALATGPIAACALAGGALSSWRTRALIVLAPALLYWQANAPVADYSAAASDPAVHSSYYAPLLGELRTLGAGYGSPPTQPARVEVVATADHWEAVWVAPHAMLARGWERQLDRYRNPLFYDESTPPTAASYRAWLDREAVSYVALSDAPPDYSAQTEARLVASAPSYLREVWRSPHWRLFAVLGARALAQPPARLSAVGTDSFTVHAPRPGTYTVRIHFTPYWALTSGDGCVARGAEDWTTIQARRAGDLHVSIRFSLARVFDHGHRCA
jgi:MFS family permease